MSPSVSAAHLREVDAQGNAVNACLALRTAEGLGVRFYVAVGNITPVTLYIGNPAGPATDQVRVFLGNDVIGTALGNIPVNGVAKFTVSTPNINVLIRSGSGNPLTDVEVIVYMAHTLGGTVHQYGVPAEDVNAAP